jgi:hypothetical protein
VPELVVAPFGHVWAVAFPYPVEDDDPDGFDVVDGLDVDAVLPPPPPQADNVRAKISDKTAIERDASMQTLPCLSATC